MITVFNGLYLFKMNQWLYLFVPDESTRKLHQNMCMLSNVNRETNTAKLMHSFAYLGECIHKFFHIFTEFLNELHPLLLILSFYLFL